MNKIKLTRQISQGSNKVLYATMLAEEEDKYCVIQAFSSQGIPAITRFLHKTWNSENIDNFALQRKFYYYIVSPQGTQSQYYGTLTDLTPWLASFNINSEKDIILLKPE